MLRICRKILDDLNKDTLDKLADKNITDHERYILNHKLSTLEEIRA